MQSSGAISARPHKRSLGLKAIGTALWSLATPDEFSSLKPTHEGELYRQDNQSGIAPRADIYLPEVDHAPSVVLVHGGGFVIGSRKMKPVRFLASEFCRAGYAVCAIDYRMIFRGGGLEQALDDVLAALLWWEKQSQSYKLDTNRIHLCGISAGATLSCLAAAKPQTDFLQSLVCFFGLYDFSALRGPLAKLFKRTLVENDEWTEYAPMQQELAPLPALLLHGDADTLVYCEQAQAFAELRQSQGLKTELKTYADQPHGFMNHVTPGSKEALQDVLGFLECRD